MNAASVGLRSDVGMSARSSTSPHENTNCKLSQRIWPSRVGASSSFVSAVYLLLSPAPPGPPPGLAVFVDEEDRSGEQGSSHICSREL